MINKDTFEYGESSVKSEYIASEDEREGESIL